MSGAGSAYIALACAGSERLLNEALSYTAHGSDLFSGITGKVNGKALRITSHLPPFDIVLSSRDSQVHIVPATESEGATNAQVSGSLPALALLAADKNPLDTYLGPVKISGDRMFFAILRHYLQGLEIDWEAWLATGVGDVPAHLVGKSVRHARKWQEQAATRTADEMENYFRHELPAAPWREIVNEFSATVVALGGDRQQLQRRFELLKSRFLQIIG